MGNIRRIKRQLKQPVAMADTKIMFNGCKVFLASPNLAVATKAGSQFAEFMNFLNERARCVNVRDLYLTHRKLLERIEEGLSLLE